MARWWRVRVVPLVTAAVAAAALLAPAGCGGAYRDYPRWRLTGGTEYANDCVEATGFVRVSGKTGVGMSVQLRSRRDCAVQVTRAELVLGDRRYPAELPPAQTLPGRSLIYLWLPFAFDNNAAWNDGRRRGQFELELTANGQPLAWTLPAVHEYVNGRWKPAPTVGGYR